MIEEELLDDRVFFLGICSVCQQRHAKLELLTCRILTDIENVVIIALEIGAE